MAGLEKQVSALWIPLWRQGLQRLLAPIALPDLMRPVGRIRSASYHPRDGVYSLIFSVPRGKWWVRGGGVWQAGGGGEIRVDGAVAFLKFSDAVTSE